MVRNMGSSLSGDGSNDNFFSDSYVLYLIHAQTM